MRNGTGMGCRLEREAEPPGQHPGSFRHGDSDGQPADALGAAGGKRLPEDDEQLLAALGHMVEASDRFSFGIVTGTLSVAEQLDFSHKLIATAGRIRARVEKTSGDHRLRPTNGAS